MFFTHERRGRKGEPFKIYKFQTMKNNTPNCATGELENPEQYITKLGKILRRTSLDELPQLWNILKGDMSFVGPRPLISSEIRHTACALNTAFTASDRVLPVLLRLKAETVFLL